MKDTTTFGLGAPLAECYNATMENNHKVSPKDVFMQLLAIVMLYASAISFITLIFQSANVHFPDQLDGAYYYLGGALGSIRFAIATLVIVFPVYLITNWFLNKLYLKEPEKRNLRIKKWLTYLTIFVAALAIISNLVALIYRFLDGEITPRFIVKVLTIFFVAISIFGYYFWELKQGKENSKNKSWWIKAFVSFVVAVVLASIIAGFLTIGSPKELRLRRFDEQRVGHLQMIQNEIISYWQRKNKLPDELTNLEDSLSGFRVPLDPESTSANPINYEYKIVSTLSFNLCANFNLPSFSGRVDSNFYPEKPYGLIGDNWTHEQGKTCFERTIDKDIYTPFPKGKE